MHLDSEIIAKIKKLKHPITKKTLLETENFIESVTVRKDKIIFIFNIYPNQSSLFDDLVAKAKKISSKVNIILTSDISTSKGQSSNLARDKARPQMKPIVARKIDSIDKVIAVASGKGGVGKSTISQQIARYLSEKMNKKVGILDADIHGPSIAKMFAIKELAKMHPKTKKIIPFVYKNLKIISFGNIIQDQTKPILFRGPLVITALKQLLFDVDWGKLDYLIIDFPPGTSDSHMSLCQNVVIDGVVMISTPQEVSFLDTQKAIVAFQKFNLKILGLIENFSYFVCPSCNTKTNIFPPANLTAKAKKFNIPFLAKLPIEPKVATYSDEGKSFLKIKNSSYIDSFDKIIKKIIETI